MIIPTFETEQERTDFMSGLTKWKGDKGCHKCAEYSVDGMILWDLCGSIGDNYTTCENFIASITPQVTPQDKIIYVKITTGPTHYDTLEKVMYYNVERMLDLGVDDETTRKYIGAEELVGATINYNRVAKHLKGPKCWRD